MARRKKYTGRGKKNYGSKVTIHFLLALLGKWIIVLPLVFLGEFIKLGMVFLLIGYVIWVYFGLAFIYYFYKFLT